METESKVNDFSSLSFFNIENINTRTTRWIVNYLIEKDEEPVQFVTDKYEKDLINCIVIPNKLSIGLGTIIIKDNTKLLVIDIVCNKKFFLGTGTFEIITVSKEEVSGIDNSQLNLEKQIGEEFLLQPIIDDKIKTMINKAIYNATETWKSDNVGENFKTLESLCLEFYILGANNTLRNV